MSGSLPHPKDYALPDYTPKIMPHLAKLLVKLFTDNARWVATTLWLNVWKGWGLKNTNEEDKVINANSAAILINLLISRGCHSGSIGPGGPSGPGGPGGQGVQGRQVVRRSEGQVVQVVRAIWVFGSLIGGTFDHFGELHWAGLSLNNPTRSFEKNNC